MQEVNKKRGESGLLVGGECFESRSKIRAFGEQSIDTDACLGAEEMLTSEA
jgi:hypothetical protein